MTMDYPSINRHILDAIGDRYERFDFDRFVDKRKLYLDIPVIHVAGSFGKSSTVHYLESIYLAAGYRVGAFYSPVISDVCEAIHLDGKNIKQEAFAEIFKDNEKDFAKFSLSGFEMLVSVAYRYFAKEKPDLLIVECGMGGELDATNLDDLPTVLSLITGIGLDHTEYLGTTLSAVAIAKAGIIKEGVPVLFANMDEAVADILRNDASKKRSSFTFLESIRTLHLVEGKVHFDYGPYKDVRLGTLSLCESVNAAMAIQATRILQERFPVSEDALREGLDVPSLPLHLEPMGRFVFDSAENEGEIRALISSFRPYAHGKQLHVFFASKKDKNIAIILPLLDNAANSLSLTTYEGKNVREEMGYFLYEEDHRFYADPYEGLKELAEAYPEDAIVCTGSPEFAALMKEFVIKENLL